MESTTTALGRSSRMVPSITSTSVSESTLKPRPSTPSLRALRATCLGDSSPETMRQPSPRCPMTCKSSVLLPTPGSPPTRTMEPGTIPPPSTRFSSPTPVSILPPPSTTGTSLRAIVFPGALAFCLVALSAKPTTFLASRTSSTKVLHSPQSGQRPSHFGAWCPQFEQTYSVLVATIRLYWIGGKVQQTMGQAIRPGSTRYRRNNWVGPCSRSGVPSPCSYRRRCWRNTAWGQERKRDHEPSDLNPFGSREAGASIAPRLSYNSL